ncbi:MAG: preprotein translocase subunit TatA [Haloferacaceae archaeon]
MVPLFPGVPGGPELIVLLLLVLLLGLPLVLVAGAVVLGIDVLGGDEDGERGADATDARIEELERRVAELERDDERDG